MPTSATPKKTGTNTGKAGKARQMVSPRSQSAIPTGAHAHNTGGKKGRSGRRPNVFKKECQGLVNQAVLPRIAEYITDPDHGPDDQGFRWAAEKLMEYGIGKPETRHHHTVDMTVVDKLARVQQLLDMAAQRAAASN